MRLIYTEAPRAGEEVRVGDQVVIRGEVCRVAQIVVPHKPSSTGRVYVEGEDGDANTRGYYPSVIGAAWIEREDQDN